MPVSDAETLARQLFERELAANSSADAIGEVAERICTQFTGGLARWFGPFGSHALFTRALARAQATHAALADVTLTDDSCFRGLDVAAREHSAPVIVDAVVAMFAALGEQLGRMIGDDFALSLLEQSTKHSVTGNNARSLPATSGNPSENSPEGGSTTVTS